MSEQQTPQPEQNIVRFPASKKERRKLLRESKDKRVRLVSALRFACGWLLLIGAFLFLLTNYQLLAPSSIRSVAEYAIAGLRQHEGDITTINYENGTFSDGALFETGLAYADSDALFLARPGSVTTLTYSLGYSSPVVEASNNYVLVYDRGGMKAALVGSAGPVAELTLSAPILTGSIGRDGRFVLVTDDQGYRTAATVYDTDGEEVFKYQSSEYYIVSAALSPDSRTLAVLAFAQNGVALDSHVLFYDVSSGDLDADAVLSDALGIELCYLESGTAAVLCDDGLYLVSRRGDAEHALTFASSDLIAVASRGSAMAIATRSYSGNARCDLYTVRGSTLSDPCGLSEEPSALAVSTAGTAVLSASGVSAYDTDFTPLWRNAEAVGARRLLMTDDGTVFALYTRNARIFTAHSEQSEELSNAQ
nr:DUF5711 family protein [uncultured Agathobaculum sp.]